MIKKRLLAGIIIIAVVAFAMYFFLSGKDPEPANTADSYSHKKWLQYQYEIQNTTNQALSNVRFSSFSPVGNTSFQKTVSIATPYPYEITSDEYGNRLLNFDFDSLAPYETRIVSITVELGYAPKPVQDDMGQVLQAYLAGETGIEVEHPDLIAQASLLREEHDIKTARAIFDWVRGYVSYSGYNADDKGALYAFRNKKGDCTEYAYLFAALSRINGIPTRIIGGFVQNGKTKMSADEYHNWVEIHIDGHWLVVDAEKGMFVEDPSNYVAMRVISSSAIGQLTSSHGMTDASEGVVVRML